MAHRVPRLCSRPALNRLLWRHGNMLHNLNKGCIAHPQRTAKLVQLLAFCSTLITVFSPNPLGDLIKCAGDYHMTKKKYSLAEFGCTQQYNLPSQYFPIVVIKSVTNQIKRWIPPAQTHDRQRSVSSATRDKLACQPLTNKGWQA